MRLMELTEIDDDGAPTVVRVNPLVVLTVRDLPNKAVAPVVARAKVYTTSHGVALYVTQDSREVANEWAQAMSMPQLFPVGVVS